MGTPSFAVPSLKALLASRHEVAAVVTQPDRPAGRGLEVRISPIKAIAGEHGLRALQPEKIRAPEFLETVRGIAPDALVVAAFGRILPKTILEAAPLGGVNVHASLLPRYRGAAPVAWAIARGERITGVTIMKMAERLDTGDIMLQVSTPISPADTGATLEARLAEMGAPLLIEALNALGEDSIAFLPQDEGKATFAPIIRKEDGRIDWTMGAVEIERRVRAFDPWPVAFTQARGKMIRIWRSRMEPGGAPPSRAGIARPGEIRSAGAAGVSVVCGGGSLLTILEVQPEGRRRMSAAEAAGGRYLAAGELLGS